MFFMVIVIILLSIATQEISSLRPFRERFLGIDSLISGEDPDFCDYVQC